MKCFALLLSIILSSFQFLFSQDEHIANPKFNFHIGLQTRVTPIYVKKYPGFITVPDRNIFEQPDRHLSGPSVLYKIERQLNNSFSMSFSQAMRYDFLHTTLPFNSQPFRGFRSVVQKSFISDFYLDGEKAFSLNNSKLNLGLGLGILGLGSDYILTQRFADNNNQSFYISSKEDFVFPAVTAIIGWQKNKFSTSLKMGYAWDNPTLFKRPFLFPELRVQYNMFSF